MTNNIKAETAISKVLQAVNKNLTEIEKHDKKVQELEAKIKDLDLDLKKGDYFTISRKEGFKGSDRSFLTDVLCFVEDNAEIVFFDIMKNVSGKILKETFFTSSFSVLKSDYNFHQYNQHKHDQ